jgi:hypothetical protein
MAGVITTGSHPKLLWPGVHATWGQVMDEGSYHKEHEDLYEIEDSDMAYEQDVELTGFGLAPIKPETAGTTYDSEIQGQITTYNHIAYALGYIVSHEEIKDNLYKKVATNRAKANAFSMRETIEVLAAFPYNNAFTQTYFTTGDGQSLISTAHVNPLGGTYSNALSPSADLSEAALEDIHIQIETMKNNRGLNIAYRPQSLHVSPYDEFTANRILKSVLQSNTANNNINVLKAMGAYPKGIMVNHYFTAPHTWFVRTNVPTGMQMFWRERPTFEQDNDFDTKNAKARSYMRLSFGCSDPRSIFASSGP